MSLEEALYETIDRYLEGNMSEQDLLAFEKELARRPDWQQKVKTYQLTRQMVLERHLLDVKEMVGQVHAQQTKARTRWRWYATGLLLLAGGLASLFYGNKLTPPKPLSTEEPTLKIEQESQPLKVPKTTSLATKPSRLEIKRPKVSQRTEKPLRTNALVDTLSKETPVVVALPQPSKAVAPQELVTPINPCAGVKLEATVFALPTCKGEHKGSVVLSAFRGGGPPYHYQLRDAQGQEVAADQLPKGEYSAELSDAHGCVRVLRGIEVKEKNCEQAFHFNPFVGERWEIPLQSHAAKLTVVDKAGNAYFSVELPAGTQEYWSGESSQGEIKTGYYLFTITHTDGTAQRGTVTIVR